MTKLCVHKPAIEISYPSGMNKKVVDAPYQKTRARINPHALNRSTKILESILEEAMIKPDYILVNALINYVDWLYTHSRDVAAISILLAIELGYSNEQLRILGQGAFLHDIGKLLIPKNVIQKPGTLNDQEMNQVRLHCELGIKVLQTSLFPYECSEIVLQHHERLDGTGYPHRLRKEEISLNSKIVMIADVLNAITSNRPYKPYQSLETAIAVLRNNPEKFDKDLVFILEETIETY